ncbi:lactonase family protein [Yinghuangia seranimata]|uniref:lactonase family protein n=1 Tax=Yinghuangia seranimata TaxID=408067 RepID=UPI00248CA711|nr:lactonase family protein [Yinghuangia seranimata]MDI2132939.1 lactonase family protein [Yinghuangia seranimata]
MAQPGDPYVYIGSYTPATDGRGTGITVCRQDPRTGDLTPVGDPVATPSPSYLVVHPNGHMLYAANELEPHGHVTSYAIAPDGTLTPVGTVPTGGSAPCHLAVGPGGRFVLTANYGDGVVSVHPIGSNGAAGPYRERIRHSGEGPVADRQSAAHAHQVVFDGDTLLVCDLGSDRVWRYQFTHSTAQPDGALQVPAGTGPRNLAFAGEPARAWVVGELDPVVLGLPDGDPVPIATADAGARNHPSAIVASPDGRFLYVGNRGPDTVAVFAVEADTVRQIGEVSVGGAWPRDLALIGDFLYVAAQDSDAVTALRRDPATGLLAAATVALKTGSPACVAAGVRRAG